MSVTIDIEILKCSKCNGYLSCSPIILLNDGSSLCGRCSASHKNNGISRQHILEQIICKIEFPCIYQIHGCRKKLLFDSTNNHELGCLYRSITCPLGINTCNWIGSIQKIIDHFKEKHSTSVLECNTFRLDLEKNQKGILMLPQDGVPFLVPFLYLAYSQIFHYGIKYYRATVESGFCNITLTNSSESDYLYRFNGGQCSAFDNNFDAKNSYIYLNTYKKILKNPKSVEIQFTVCFSNEKTTLTVDYELLEKLRCFQCQDFLTPPIFESKNGVVCHNCNDNCILSTDLNLSELMKNAAYPCRWHNCEFVGTCYVIEKHQNACAMRKYQCFVSRFKQNACNKNFVQQKLIQHMQLHECNYFENQFCYTVVFKKVNLKLHFDYTIVDNEIVGIERTGTPCSLYFRAWTSRRYPKETIIVTFEHSHCTLKSKVFKFSPDLQQCSITLDNLPACFANYDEITVILQVKVEDNIC